MVNGALTLGGIVGVLLSGGFVYWQVGRYATPQVPRTLFDERREVFAYTAGLFVGIPLAFPLLLLFTSLSVGALLPVPIELLGLVGGAELAQWLVLRSHYFGSGTARPFYAVGLRAGIGGILVLAVVTQYFGALAPTPLGVGLILLQSVAIVAIEVAAGLLSMPPVPKSGRTGGGPLSGALVSAGGFFLIGMGALLGTTWGFAGALAAAAGGALVFRRLRDPVLGRVRPPASEEEAGGQERAATPAFGRTDR